MTDAPTTPDPIEMAMAAEASGRTPEGIAHEVLRKQSALLGWQIASERAGFGLKVLIGLAGISAAALLGVLAWQASRADGVLLEPFTVPPAMAADGVSGEVIAAQVLDELSRLRLETVETGGARAYQNDWGREISVAIPTTGISLGDLQAALRAWLGRETRITGEVYRTESGVAVRVRVQGGGAIEAEGPAGDLRGLARSIARGVYRETQPARYARYLIDHGDPAGGATLAQTAALSAAGPRTRAEAYAAWGYAMNQLSRVPEAIALETKARQLAPDWWLPAYQLANDEYNRSHSEAALHHMRDAARLRVRDPSLPRGARNADFYLGRAAAIAQQTDRVAYFQRAADDPATVAAIGSTLDRSLVASTAATHDIAGAAAHLARPQFVRPWRGQPELDTLERARANLQENMQDWAGLRDTKATLLTHYGNFLGLIDRAEFGLATALAGDVAGGRAILDALPADCDLCQLNRARTLAAGGDWAAAERLAAVVEARTPSIPDASLIRGRILLDAGKTELALASFREARRRQPRWADAWKFEGDALAKLGRWKEAEAAYAKAYPLAPKWGGLHLNWSRTLAKLGKSQDAAAHRRTAAGLYLTAPERAELAALK